MGQSFCAFLFGYYWPVPHSYPLMQGPLSLPSMQKRPPGQVSQAVFAAFSLKPPGQRGYTLRPVELHTEPLIQFVETVEPPLTAQY